MLLLTVVLTVPVWFVASLREVTTIVYRKENPDDTLTDVVSRFPDGFRVIEEKDFASTPGMVWAKSTSKPDDEIAFVRDISVFEGNVSRGKKLFDSFPQHTGGVSSSSRIDFRVWHLINASMILAGVLIYSRKERIFEKHIDNPSRAWGRILLGYVGVAFLLFVFFVVVSVLIAFLLGYLGLLQR